VACLVTVPVGRIILIEARAWIYYYYDFIAISVASVYDSENPVI
jgi:hypothetical protein